MATTQRSGPVRLRAENVGGIDETEVTFSPGVTVLTGRNATNRTSLLQAIMAALGGERVSLKGDADEGFAELDVGGETYARRLERRGDSVVMDGEPYLDDPEIVDLFAFLHGTNEARQAVARGDDLREVIMRPVDTEAIREDVERLEAEKRRLDDELDAIDSRKGELPELEQERTRLESEIEDKRAELEEKETELTAADADVGSTREDKAELEAKLEELRETRSELEEVRYRVETQRESVESLREQRAGLEADRDDLPETPAGELSEVEARMEALREERQDLQSAVGDLQSTIQFNEDALDGSGVAALDALGGDGEEGSPTDRLVEAETVTCWTCGSEVEREQIAATVEQLRELRQEKLSRANELRAELEELKDRRTDLEGDRQERRQVERRLDEVEREIAGREETIEELQERRDELGDEVAGLEAEISDLEDEDFEEVLSLHREANQLEFETAQLEEEFAAVTEEMAAVEDRIGERDQVAAQRNQVTEELADLRTRIDSIEAEAVEAFNDHMDAVLDVLEYGNLERIWIERTRRQVREGRRTVERSAFDLHVVRNPGSGATYEDTVDHLSESEREVAGLVFALAGYLVHDVHEVVPFMLLDSLEALDSARIAALLDYLREFSEHLVVALLPEDATALEFEHDRVTDI